uniref:Uncharacterized protein n=1 Tax=Nelumbo nucifera TaxID=4432 RepID=A0A822Z0W0_NELNU|nr:TPA_asm: hypothetical protein HUJ06_007770 [Nelumbo nucifera]
MGVDPNDAWTRFVIREADSHRAETEVEVKDDMLVGDNLTQRLQRNELTRWSSFKDQLGLEMFKDW